ncbi:MAG: hypothetical protein IKG21_01570 [Atopobiaceae bacterium]|nr:hypothetical protein [Atopobiaceae bacterium]
MELHDAVCTSLREDGIAILQNSRRFLALTLDYADPDSPLTGVFGTNCDGELMAFFTPLAKDCTQDAVLSATNRSTALLASMRYIHPVVARHLASEMAVGICAYMGTTPPDEVLDAARSEIDWSGTPWASSALYGDTPPIGSPSLLIDDYGDSIAPEQIRNQSRETDSYGDSLALKQISAGVSVLDQAAAPSFVSRQVSAPGTYLAPDGERYGPVASPAPYQPVQRAPMRNGKLIFAIVAACAVGIGALVVLMLQTGSTPHVDGDAENIETAMVATSKDAQDNDALTADAASEVVSFAGTWSPVSVEVNGADAQAYDTRLRCAKEKDLVLCDDGTFTRSVFPDLLEGTWEKVDESSIELRPKNEKEDINSWDKHDLKSPPVATHKDDQLRVTYGDGVSVVYKRGVEKPSSDKLVGLWEIVENAEGGVVHYRQDDFESERATGYYTKYLDIRASGSIIWDQQGKLSQGHYRMIGDGQAVAYIRSESEPGRYWLGLLELEDGQLTFHYRAEDEGDWEKFQRAEKDNRADLRKPES